jgi:hypothetical protein
MDIELAKKALDNKVINQAQYDKVLASQPKGVEETTTAGASAVPSIVSPTPSPIIASPATSPTTPTPVTADQLQVTQAQPPAQAIAAPIIAPVVAKVDKNIETAIKEGEDAANKQAAFAEGFHAQSIKDASDLNSRMQVEKASIDEQMIGAQKELDKVSKQEIKPYEIFSDMPTWQKIGLALVSIASAPIGLSMLSGMIDRDVEAQKNNIANKMEGAKTKLSYYQKMKESLKDDQMATLATKAAMFDSAKMKLDTMANQTKNAQFKVGALQQAQQLDMQKQEIMAKMQERATVLAQQTSIQNQTAKSDPMMAKIMSYPENVRKPLLEAKDKYESTTAAKSYVDEAFGKSEEIGGVMGNMPFSERKATVDTYNAGIESAVRSTMKGQGTIQETEIVRLIQPFLISPTDTVGVMKTKREQIKKILDVKSTEFTKKLQSFNILPPSLKTIKENK